MGIHLIKATQPFERLNIDFKGPVPSNANNVYMLTLSLRRPLSYRNQAIDLLRKSMDWFLYDNSLRHERVNSVR